MSIIVEIAETNIVLSPTETNKIIKVERGSIDRGVATGGTTGQVLSKIDSLDYNTEWTDAGSGDMTRSIYDPTNIIGDAFDMDNMVEGATTKILTTTERTNIGNNTTHAALVAGNPHVVTLAEVGGTTDHTLLSNIGDNAHSVIDTHLGASNPHSLSAGSGANTDITSMSGITGDISTVNTLSFNITPSLIYAEGNVSWDVDQHTLTYDTEVANLSFLMNQTLVQRVRNDTASPILKGKLVYMTGSQGDRATIEMADASIELTSRRTIGFVAETINPGQDGYVVLAGRFSGVNTVGSTEGKEIFLSEVTGDWTEVPPVTPAHATIVGKIIKAASNGIIDVHVLNGFELYELHDVLITSIADLQNIEWNDTGGYWVNSSRLTDHIAATNPHTGSASTELDNLGTTAINADLLPSSDNTRDLGTSANKFKDIFAVNMTFEDQNAADFTVKDLSTHQLEAYNDLATTEFDITALTSAGVRTITINQAEAEKLEFIIGEKRLEQPTQVDMTKVHTGLNGTDASPNAIYTYIQNDGGDAPELDASNVDPNGGASHVDGVYEIVGSIAGSVANVYATNNIHAAIHEKIEKMLDRFKEQGSLYLSGMDITADIDTFSITSGTAKHVLDSATIPSLTIDSGVPVDNQFTIEDDSTYTTYDDFQIDEYFDGDVVANNNHVKCRIGVVINNPELTSARFHIIPQNGGAKYVTPSQAWADLSKMAVTTPRDNIVKYSFVAVADIVIKNSSGTFELIAHPDTGLFYADVRESAGGGGAGGGAGSQNLYESVTGNTGSTTAPSATATLAIEGGTGASVAVTTDTATINVTDRGQVNGQATITFDGGGSVLTTGAKAVYLEVPYTGTITANRLFADQSGSIVIDIWKDTYANFPPTVADTITAAAKPTLSSAIKSEDTTLTAWTTTVTKGDILEFNIDSITTITKCTLTLQITKTAG